MKKLKMYVAALASLLVLAACSSESTDVAENVSSKGSVVEVNVTAAAELVETQEEEKEPEPEEAQEKPEEQTQSEHKYQKIPLSIVFQRRSDE